MRAVASPCLYPGEPSRYHARPMAVPKQRQSSARRDKRRAHDALSAPRLNECPQCHSPRLSHRVCRNCGTYKGREVIAPDEPTFETGDRSEGA